MTELRFKQPLDSEVKLGSRERHRDPQGSQSAKRPHWEPELQGPPGGAKRVYTDTKSWSRLFDGALSIKTQHLS